MRNVRARSARDAGDQELATSISQLRKPTKSAWLANLLVRRHHDEIGELLSLGASLRDAQAELAGEQLRRLSARRHEVVVTLAHRAQRVAQDEGEPVSDAVERELQDTLEAALADADAADALRSGRLTTALRYAGLGGVDTTEAVAAPDAVSPPADRRTGGKRTSAAVRKAARQRLADAEQDVQRARQAAQDAEDAVGHTTQARNQLQERIKRLENELSETREQEARGTHEVHEAQRSRDRAARDLRRAQGAVRQARARVDRLSD